MKNEYAVLVEDYRENREKYRGKVEKVFSKEKYIFLYNFIVHMYIFELDIFGLQIRPTWYGFMYALGFIISYFFMKKNWKYRWNDLDSLLYFIFFWVVLWGRLWYVLLYDPLYFIKNPDQILAFWNGGMSFHWGLLGVILAILLFSKRKWYQFFDITDSLAVIIPIALWLWRIGNYINKELLWFSPYDGPFRIIKGGTWYFPSPLLEMLLEGIMLFTIMIFFLRKWAHKQLGKLSAIFLIGYGTARIVAEQFRLPDAHIGYLFDTKYFTIGMLYTLPIIIIGIILLIWSRKSPM